MALEKTGKKERKREIHVEEEEEAMEVLLSEIKKKEKDESEDFSKRQGQFTSCLPDSDKICSLERRTEAHRCISSLYCIFLAVFFLSYFIIYIIEARILEVSELIWRR